MDDAYDWEMSREQHQELLTALEGVRGAFLLSGYHSELYDEWADGSGYTCHEVEIDCKAGGQKVKGRRVECVWANR